MSRSAGGAAIGLWLLAAIAHAAEPLSAQGHTAAFTESEARSTSLAEICEERASIVRDRATSPEEIRLHIQQLAYCELSGPEVLVEAWEDPALRSIDPFALGQASGMIQDQRIFDAVLRVVLDEGAPADDRLAGVGVLAGYLIPGLYVPPRNQWRTFDHQWPPVHGPRTHSTWMQGREPLAPGTSDRILELLRALRGDWEDRDISRAGFGLDPGEGFRPTAETHLAVAAYQVLRTWERRQGY